MEAKGRAIDFVRWMPGCIKVSASLFIIGLIVIAIKGKNVLGLDFTGGYLQQVEYSHDCSKEKSEVMKRFPGVKVQQLQGSNHEIIYSVDLKQKESLKQFVQAQEGSQIKREELVGPTVGKQLRTKGILSILLALLGILIYVGIRFELIYSVAAVVALFHDVLLALAVYIILGKQVNLQTIAALLTIVGYSLNDTIVVFDRLRETISRSRTRHIAEDINNALNATLTRTLLTSLTTFFVVFLLTVFGGGLISSFALLLLIGVIVGTYSSIFIASSVVLKVKQSQ